MNFANRIVFALFLSILYFGSNTANAQLWRYLNDSPEAQRAAEMALNKEAISVITKPIVVYGDTLSYDIRTYSLQSFDGIPCEISLWERPFDRSVFHIDLPDDSLVINDFYSLSRVHHLSNNLLEIVYSPRGGSDQGFDHVLLLGVNKGKFCIVAEILSINEYAGPDEYGLYNLHLKLSGKSVDNYQLALHIRDLCKSTKPKKSFDRSSDFMLKFDKIKHIFYNETKLMDIVTQVYDVYEGKTKPLHIKGRYPAINLGEYKYLFIKGRWFSFYKRPETGVYYLTPNTVKAKSNT